MKVRSIKERKYQKRKKELECTLEELSNSIVLVEGKKDREALARIGIENVFTIGNGMEKAFSKINTGEVIILTDFDTAGEKLAKRAEEALIAHKIKPNMEIRKKLRYVLPIQNIENIEEKIEAFNEECGRFI